MAERACDTFNFAPHLPWATYVTLLDLSFIICEMNG